MRTKEVRLELGVEIEKRVLAKGGTREDILLNDEVVIELPALKRPTLEELQAKYPWVKSIERDDSPEEAVTFRLATVLKSTEPLINGATYERRLAKLRAEGLLLGYQHLRWFVENQHEFPEPLRSAVKALVGKICIDFPGLVVVNAGGRRYVPYLDDDGERFVVSWSHLAYDFLGSGRIAVSRK